MFDEFGHFGYSLSREKCSLMLLMLKFNGKLAFGVRVVSKSIELSAYFTKPGLQAVRVDVDHLDRGEGEVACA